MAAGSSDRELVPAGFDEQRFALEGLARLEVYLDAWARFVELYPDALEDDAPAQPRP